MLLWVGAVLAQGRQVYRGQRKSNNGPAQSILSESSCSNGHASRLRQSRPNASGGNQHRWKGKPPLPY